MKKQILVLDAFTHGHEAALKLLRKMRWRKAACDIVFCGSHAKVFDRLTEGHAYAVVPVTNTIAGEVAEVTSRLAALGRAGYTFRVIAELDLRINHCLLAPKDVTLAEDLTRVMSHEKAIQQCGDFLDRIGIPPEKRDRQDSTGNAAKAVSRLEPGTLTGAISSKAAAKAYGLHVLAEQIQDAKRNQTHFILLENTAVVAPKTVGIIGSEGRYGTALRAHFSRIGCRVIGADKNAKGLTNIQVVKQADVVIFAVPISETVRAIRSVARYSRSNQLFMDITSVKGPAVKAMCAGKAQVVGLHPMFAPEVSFAGQTIVACPVRLDAPAWKTWVVNVLATTGAKIKWSTPAEHDLYMTTVQSSPHLANLVNATLLVQMGVSATESLQYTSPFYRVMFSLMGRLLSQNPSLYSSILMENPDTCTMLERRIRIEHRILRMIREKDDIKLCQLFAQAKTHFGEPVTTEANELFLRLIAVTTTLYGDNSVILEFTREHNRPGLLERILRVFRRRRVNLSGINFVSLDDKRLQFTVAFERSRNSDEVRLALQEIEGWNEPRVKALT